MTIDIQAIAGDYTAACALTIDGQTRRHGPGMSSDIPAGVEHAVAAKAGTIAIDVLAEANRYPLRAR